MREVVGYRPSGLVSGVVTLTDDGIVLVFVFLLLYSIQFVAASVS